jgi:hypothetical protein
MKTEATISSETPVRTRSRQVHSLGDGIPRKHRREHRKSYNSLVWLRHNKNELLFRKYHEYEISFKSVDDWRAYRKTRANFLSRSSYSRHLE